MTKLTNQSNSTQDTEDVVAELAIAKAVITEANNSLYGSQGYFLTCADGSVAREGDTPDKYHLAKKIEELKAQSNKDYHRAQSLSDRIDVLEANVVELWHESEAGRKALHEYLGMSWEEYIIWATPRAALHQEGIAPK